MEIILDEYIKDYITENGVKRIVLNNYQTKVCCGGAALPVVSFKDPDQSKSYYIYQLENDIEVFIDATMKFKDNQVIIKCRDYSLFKDFEIEGVKLL